MGIPTVADRVAQMVVKHRMGPLVEPLFHPDSFSYRRVVNDYAHTSFPNKMILDAENVVQWLEWKAVIDRNFVAGIFVWTGIDYLGEAKSNWPVKGTDSGVLDMAGFEKPS